MPDDHEQEGKPAPDYRRGYYDREGRWMEYRDIGHAGHHRPAAQGVIWAVVLIAVGTLFFLDNVGLLRFHDVWKFWPLGLIALGVAKLFDSRGIGAQVWAGMWIIVGAAFLLDHLGIWSLNWGTIWPLALVLFGVFMLVNALERRQAPNLPTTGASQSTTSDKTLREWATFGGIKRRVDTNDFQGGEMVAVFGGIDIDLRRAAIAPDTKEVIIDANATFGGIELRVPENWTVIMRGIGVFGGYEDKTIPPRESDRATAPRLVIKGYAVFGGVSVQN